MATAAASNATTKATTKATTQSTTAKKTAAKTPATRKTAAPKKPTAHKKTGNATRRVHARAHAHKATATKRWSAHVNETSDAMTLEHDIFKTGTAEEIAASLKKSSTHSKRRKASPFQSAMSMLNFYTNRAGRNLSKPRKQVLQQAKKKLREAFGREA